MDRTDTGYTIDRELSWLRFNKRVLEEGKDKEVPLLERLKFISIFSTNLDEFYMVRVGRLYDFLSINVDVSDNKSGFKTEEKLEKILQKTKALLKKRDENYQEIINELKNQGIIEYKFQELDKIKKKEVENYFKTFVHPILSPMIINREHPFPHIPNGQPYIILRLKDKKDSGDKMGIIPIPSSLKNIYRLDSEDKIEYIRVEEIVKGFAQEIFSKNTLEKLSVITVTRSADLTLIDSFEEEEEEEDLRLYMKKLLKKRPRLSPVKIQIEGELEEPEKSFLLKKLKLNENQIFYTKAPSDLTYAFGLIEEAKKLEKLNLIYPEFQPSYPKTLNRSSIIEQINKKDLLLSYPYDQIEPFIQLLKEASEDKSVISIQITLYRLASKSKIAQILCDAAENGKEVTAVMELKARFDEINNIQWAERLEESGCNVIYGFENYKVHSKICLITRANKTGVSYITQVGTGNYNEKTATLYTDFSLITADLDIGSEAKVFFNNMMTGDLEYPYKNLLVAPSTLKSGLISLITEQIQRAKQGLNSRIVIKINSLTDKELIDALVEASNQGVEVKLLVRGICCLVPGIKNKTENITVTSIVGRFLEHHRIYVFGPLNDSKIFIASADFMTRSTQRRVEIACPIKDKLIKEQIEHIIEVTLRDNVKSQNMNCHGVYNKKKKVGGISISSQDIFIKESFETLEEPKENRGSNGFGNWMNKLKSIFQKSNVRKV